MMNNIVIGATKYILVIIFSFLLTYSAGSQSAFLDVSVESGFNATGINRGIAISDYNNDGHDDVYISRINGPNMLYRNNGDGTFTDVAAAAGVDTGLDSYTSVWGDFDNDGYLDLYVGNRESPNLLYHNNGDGTFTNIAATAGVDLLSKPRSVLVADVDRDGFLDLYVANLSEENALFKNNGNLTFTDITQESGTNDTQLSMGSMFFDYDNDGDLDLYLTHDGNQAYKLLQNDGTGNFVDVSAASGTNYQGLGMGVDFGDINNDGWLDIYITNLSYNTLYLNNTDGTFTNISGQAMVTDPGMGWGTTFLDFDNDGWQDIYMVNDSYFSPLPNILYRNKGDNTFEVVSDDDPIASMYATYGIGCTDINFDGRVDIFVTNTGVDGNQVFSNDTPQTGNWFKVKLEGTVSNRAAIGARVTLYAGGKVLTDEVAGGTGYASQNSLTLHFGLGDVEMIDEMIIRWPNGLEESYANLEVNQTMHAVENGSLSVNTKDLEPTAFQIDIFPNPVLTNRSLNIKVQARTSQDALIYVTDLLGRKVDVIFQGVLESEKVQLEWQPDSGLQGWVNITIQSDQTTVSKLVYLQ